MVTLRTRAGFTLAEVVVSLTLVATALFGVTAASAWAVRTTMSAEALETALAQGDALLDSLVRSPSPTSGAARRGANTIRWETTPSPAGSKIDLHVDYFDGASPRTLSIEHVLTIPALNPVGSAQ
jgi:Tfp pilus assembly protein PilV